MKKLAIFLFFVALNVTAGFTGHWENNKNSRSMSLDLIEKEGELSGRYCFLTNNGNRIDCTEEDDINMTGVINNNIATVTFDSTFGGEGKATLTVINDSLTYSIKDKSPFVEANMSVPDEIIFDRVISN